MRRYGVEQTQYVDDDDCTVQLLPGPYGHYEATRWYAPAARIAIQHEERLVLGGQTRERSESRLKELTLQD